jgi:hypothetical protein
MIGSEPTAAPAMAVPVQAKPATVANLVRSRVIGISFFVSVWFAQPAKPAPHKKEPVHPQTVIFTVTCMPVKRKGNLFFAKSRSLLVYTMMTERQGKTRFTQTAAPLG